MNATEFGELEFDNGELQWIVEHEMACMACEALVESAPSVENLHDGIPGSNNLSNYFKKNELKPRTLQLIDGPKFLGSEMRFFIFALAKYDIRLGSISFGYLRGLQKALGAISKKNGMKESDTPNIVETIILYYFSIYSEHDLAIQRLSFDLKSIQGGVEEFLDEIRRELNDRHYVPPEINRAYIMSVVAKFVWLWFTFNQEEVLGELYEVVA